jgi:hypothetical protein
MMFDGIVFMVLAMAIAILPFAVLVGLLIYTISIIENNKYRK